MTAEIAPAADGPFYAPSGREVEVFAAAARRGHPVMLKGPTGSGKTRLVEYMAWRLDVPLYTVSCHEDLTASDLVGRFVLDAQSTVWVDGPLTRAVRDGGLCYLDEIVEAHQDATVVIHSLADHRRELHIDRLGGSAIKASPQFTLVVSYNPGYQSVLKDLKPSTRQRMVAIELDFPSPATETAVIIAETGVDAGTAEHLVRFGAAVRRLEEPRLHEVASTRTLVIAADLIAEGLSFVEAATAAVAGSLTDDQSLSRGLASMAEAFSPGHAGWPTVGDQMRAGHR